MKTVAVIGAGASGLCAVKCCLDEGLQPVCFERTDDIGGLWKFKDDVVDDQACVMKSTVINTSKEMMCYSDFPIPKEYPIFMHNTYVQKYFRLYADKFQLQKYVHFKTEVLHIKRKEDFDQTGQWEVKVKNLDTGAVEERQFDAVMVCTGHHASVNKPTFPGLDRFKGKVLHSHDYKDLRGYEGKRIVIIGIGNSGGDAAVELSRIASQVYLSTRRGTWVLNRVAQKGMPFDMINLNRVTMALKDRFPSLFNKIAEFQVNQRFNHKAYSLQPSYHIFAQHPMVNDDLPNRIICGSVIPKPDVQEFTETGVKFDNGEVVDDIDVVILATGYVFGFPFLDKSVIDVKRNEVELFKFVFPPDLSQPTLAVVGCFQPLGAIMPIAEMQCRLATRVFKGQITLPSREAMWEDIRMKREKMAAQYVKSQRHTIQVDYISFMDELAGFIGCKPDIGKLLLTDPKLAMMCWFSACTPYQFRLQGPGAWAGARHAILTQWERTLQPLQTRPLGWTEKESQMKFFFFFAVFACIVAYILSCLIH